MANSQAVVVAPQNIADLATTISQQAENAARNAVAMHPKSAMVVIQPSTGKILAIANNAGQNDFALTAAVAPGSTMKVITSTALISAGVLTPSSPVACPAAYTVTGITYHNDQHESEPPGTPFMHRLRAVLQQRVQHAVAAPDRRRLAGRHRAEVLRPQPEVEHRPRQPVRPATSTPRRAPAALSWPRRRSARAS